MGLKPRHKVSWKERGLQNGIFREFMVSDQDGPFVPDQDGPFVPDQDGRAIWFPTEMVSSATEMLCELHSAGFIHGRPHVKDFTWYDGRVGFLDFEEDPTQVMTWHEARARDVWMFLFAVAGYLTQPKQRDEVLAAASVVMEHLCLAKRDKEEAAVDWAA